MLSIAVTNSHFVIKTQGQYLESALCLPNFLTMNTINTCHRRTLRKPSCKLIHTRYSCLRCAQFIPALVLPIEYPFYRRHGQHSVFLCRPHIVRLLCSCSSNEHRPCQQRCHLHLKERCIPDDPTLCFPGDFGERDTPVKRCIPDNPTSCDPSDFGQSS